MTETVQHDDIVADSENVLQTVFVHSNKKKIIHKFWTFPPATMHHVRHVFSSVIEKPHGHTHIRSVL